MVWETIRGKQQCPRLTVAKVKSLHTPGRYGDGSGLYLNIAKRGSKSWVQRITIDGRRRDMGLGGYPDVGLAQARRRAADNRAAVADGRNPMAENRRASTPTFRKRRERFMPSRFPRGATKSMPTPGCRQSSVTHFL